MPPARPDYPTLAGVDPAHYVITREIARGGMGRVLVARDRRLGREVALKEMLAPGGAVARRFEREARITARLAHPSIISVFEAGVWPSGEPFYAMPLVTGRSLDEVILAATTYAARLALLPNVLAVADAMAYAHDRRVVHRDLKPRNIVVGEFGETVVLDWGIAKDLAAREPDEPGDRTVDARATTAPVEIGAPVAPGPSGPIGPIGPSGETTVGEVLGTPAYMPPEQAEGKPVDERADVYAIGALLYHVLAGAPPFVRAGTAELLAAVIHESPPPLRARVPDAPRELVAIIERAMAREPAARYRTARALADDLRRFQTGQLVGAHRYSLGQLVRRWIARHRTAVVATAVAVLVAVAVGVVAVQRVVAAEQVARTERAAAIARASDAEGLMQFMLVDLQDRLTAVGKLELLDAVARRAAAVYDARGDAGPDSRSDDDVLYAAMARLGIGGVLEARGDLAGASAAYDRARESLDALAARRPDVPRYTHRALTAGFAVAAAQVERGEPAAALVTYRELLARAQVALDARPTDVDAIHDVYVVHTRLGGILHTRGDLAPALAEYQLALALAVRHAAVADPARGDKDLLNAHAYVGRLLELAHHDTAGALAEYRIALALGQAESSRDPHNPQWLRDVAVSHDEIGATLFDHGDPVTALAEYQAALVASGQALAIDPSNTDILTTQTTAEEKVGIALLARKDLAGATAAFVACQATWTTLVARDPTNTEWARDQSVIDNKIGDVQLEAHDAAGALASYRRALATRERLVAKDPTSAHWRRDLMYSHFKLATAYRVTHDRARTLVELRAAIAIAEDSAAAHPTNDQILRDVAATHTELGDELAAAGQAADALAEYRAALATAERAPPSADWTELANKLRAKLTQPIPSKLGP